MHRIHRYVSSLILAAALVAPTVVMATPTPQEVQVRVYDRDHHDYHNWDEREDHVYRGYLAEQHRSYLAYERQKHSVQRNYWNWRHSHPDHD
jgi:hypothetical protein